MTIVIVGIISIPLSLLLVQHVESTFQSHDYTGAIQLARDEIERVKNTNYDSINNLSFTSDDYLITRTIQETSTPPEGLKQVRVDVQRSGSLNILYTLFTNIARNVSICL